MNKDNAHLYLPLVEALRDGELEVKTSSGWSPCNNPTFYNPPDDYRRRPKRNRVPLEMGNLPFPCAIKPEHGETYYLVYEAGPFCVAIYGTRLEYSELLKEGWLYSPTPNDPTSWKRCEKEVEE